MHTAVLISIISGVPSEIYTYGTQFFLILIGIGIGVLISGQVWIPILYDLKVVSIYQYFFLRYKSKFPRRLMSIIFVLKVCSLFMKAIIMVNFMGVMKRAACYRPRKRKLSTSTKKVQWLTSTALFMTNCIIKNVAK